ncbi:MAG: DUF2142 domain-containing protein [Clostridium sp.]|nr:DUF2142 domain-containing protein [Clostridium sp.]MCM1173242.1 DUF2142 domain-containing protein [Clostridium sp.]MCM1208356.1 DUF2142 domain-containing protein [Ruminococcus sp.]
MDKKNNVKKNCIRWAVIVAVSLLFSVLTELVFNYKLISIGAANRGVFSVSMEELSYTGFALDGTTFVATGEEPAVIRIDKPVKYLSKLSYNRSTGTDTRTFINVYSGGAQNEIIDANNRCISLSEQVVNGSVDYIEMVFEKPYEGMEISGITYDNTINFSWRRMLLFAVGISIVLFLLLFRKTIGEHMEFAFAYVALAVGLVMAIGFPVQKVSWDEEYHFTSAYHLSISKVVMTPEILYYGDAYETGSLMYPKSEKEFSQFKEFLDGSDIYNYDNAEQVQKGGFMGLSSIGHIPSAIGMNIARLFKLPLSYLYIFGRVFNLLFYVLCCFFAIKYMKLGKRLLAVAALMPTNLFLASVFSYDAAVNGMLFLATAIILSDIADEKAVFNWKKYVFTMGLIFVASAIKIVYIPFVLLILIVPKDRFKTKKDMLIMKGLIIAGVVFAVALLLFFVDLADFMSADLRGGETNVAKQVAYMLDNIPTVAGLVVKSIASSFVSYSVGNGAYGLVGHFGEFPYEILIIASMCVIILTDSSELMLNIKSRVGVALVMLATTVVVWLSMYIVFTPVGSQWIGGVQGRYFAPIRVPCYLLLALPFVKLKIPKALHNAAVLLVPVVLNCGILAVAFCSWAR